MDPGDSGEVGRVPLATWHRSEGVHGAGWSLALLSPAWCWVHSLLAQPNSFLSGHLSLGVVPLAIPVVLEMLFKTPLESMHNSLPSLAGVTG